MPPDEPPIPTGPTRSMIIISKPSLAMAQVNLFSLPSKKEQIHFDQFLEAINKDIVEINKLIERYNTSELTDIDRVRLLRAIHQAMIDIEHRYSSDFLEACRGYRKRFHEQLFLAIKEQAATLPCKSISGLISSTDASEHCFATILANMHPDKVRQFTSILIKYAGRAIDVSQRNKELEGLFSPDEEGREEYEDFLATHYMEYLGGGNSKNFKITDLDGSNPIVLKIENRLGVPSSAEFYLRERSLAKTCTAVLAERQVVVREDSSTELVIRSLQIGEFCTGGDIEDHSALKMDNAQRVQSALDIYSQMATILCGIQSDDAAFFDMKNSNWLIDDKGRLRIADTKALIRVTRTEDGLKLSKKDLDEHWTPYLLHSRHIKTPEHDSVFRGKSISVDKAHAFIIGKNLYQYLTQCNYSYLVNKNSHTQFNFDYPIFKTPKGTMLQELIKKLVEPDPAKRMPLKDVITHLRDTELHLPLSACEKVLTDLKLLQFGQADLKLDDFIKQKKELINRATTKDELNSVLRELYRMKADLSNEQSNFIKQIITSFRERSTSLFSVGMAAKAERIEKAMAKVPLEERNNIMHSPSKEARAVRKALASHRVPIQQILYSNEAKEPDVKNAARTFIEFKNKYSETKDDKSPPKSPPTSP